MWRYINNKKLKVYNLLFISSIVFSISLLIWLMPYPQESNGYINNNEIEKKVTDSDQSIQIQQFGAWMSHQIPLEQITDPVEMKKAIDLLLKQGYSEYYFPILNYESEDVEQKVEDMLTVTDNTKLKMIAILLPPSEAGDRGNYDWYGWMEYLNSLKEFHPSFYGFVIDDFNWFKSNEEEEDDDDDDDNEEPENEQQIEGNVEFMIESGLDKALQNKRKDLHFYPVLYFEGIDTNDAKRYFYDNSDGIILATPAYYNVTDLKENLDVFAKVFKDKPLKYVLYTARTTAFIELGYSPPSDRLILSTVSIVNSTDSVDGIIVWRNTNIHTIQDYLANRNNTEYLSFMTMMEQFQLKDENETSRQNAFSSILVSQIDKEENQNDENDDKGANKDSSEKISVWLGIEGFNFEPIMAEEMRISEDIKGIVIQSVVPGSPAFKAGLKDLVLDVDADGYLIQKGDIITSVDGEEIEGFEDILDIMKEKQSGDLLELSINRNGNLINKTITLEPIPT
jgi:hypothetical protein